MSACCINASSVYIWFLFLLDTCVLFYSRTVRLEHFVYHVDPSIDHAPCIISLYSGVRSLACGGVVWYYTMSFYVCFLKIRFYIILLIRFYKQRWSSTSALYNNNWESYAHGRLHVYKKNPRLAEKKNRNERRCPKKIVPDITGRMRYGPHTWHVDKYYNNLLLRNKT